MLDSIILQFENWHNHLAPTLRLAFDFFVVIILIRGILARRISDSVNIALTKLFAAFQARYVRSERDFAVWLHYKNKAADRGHKHHLADCDDDKCSMI